jgi:adenosine deaminase
MCKSDLHPLIAALPKVELHIHIEGTLSPELLFTLAAKNGIELPTPAEDPAFASPTTLIARYDAFTSLPDFLGYYNKAMRVLMHATDFEDLTYAYFTTVAKDNLRHAEIFFDPQAHTSRGVDYLSVVTGISAARRRALQDFGITSELIMCFHRDQSVAEAESIFEVAVELGHFEDGTLIGIGMDNCELGYPPELFKSIYHRAEDLGIRRTAHAGEEGDATYISRAIDECHVERIDHGIKLATDEKLMERVAGLGITLTVCPVSNIKLQCVKDVKEVPIELFLEEGVKFCLNSDDPAYFGAGLLENWCAVQTLFGFGKEVWKKLAVMGIDGSWAGDVRKRELLLEVEKVLEGF